MKILIINGPNLNLLGVRDTNIYGSETFENFLGELRKTYPQIQIDYYQSNVEGELINALHQAIDNHSGVILNAGGYTHTSVALADAVGSIASLGVKTVEVHISNILAREEFRHVSMISSRCAGSIFGFGLKGYELALTYFLINK